MADDVIGWEGLVLPYGSKSPVGDQRVVYASSLPVPNRDLPLPLKVQWSSAPGHDNAEQGLAQITRVWSTDEGLWASGPIDVTDPRGAELARKIGSGFLGWVSADIETDGGEMVQELDGRRRHGYRKWRLFAVTLVADAAFDQARILPVTDPKRIVSADQARSSNLVTAGGSGFASMETVTFASGRRIAMVGEVGPEVLIGYDQASTFLRSMFAVTGDVDLPWAERDHQWDGSGASRRVQEWAAGDPQRMARAFLWRNDESDPATQAAYSLGFADVIDDELRAVYSGLSAAAGRLNQTQNGMTPADRERVAARIATLYERAASAFDDPAIAERREGMSENDQPVDGFAVAVPGQETVVVDDVDTDTVRISDEDVDRIAEAVVQRLNESDAMAQAEFQRVRSVRELLDGVST